MGAVENGSSASGYATRELAKDGRESIDNAGLFQEVCGYSSFYFEID
jgi:hypothetical protein